MFWLSEALQQCACRHASKPALVAEAWKKRAASVNRETYV